MGIYVYKAKVVKFMEEGVQKRLGIFEFWHRYVDRSGYWDSDRSEEQLFKGWDMVMGNLQRHHPDGLDYAILGATDATVSRAKSLKAAKGAPVYKNPVDVHMPCTMADLGGAFDKVFIDDNVCGGWTGKGIAYSLKSFHLRLINHDRGTPMPEEVTGGDPFK